MTDTDTDLERRLRELAVMSPVGAATARSVDTTRAWRDLRDRRSRSRTARRRLAVAATIACVGAAAAGIPVLAGGLAGHRQPGHRQHGPAASQGVESGTATNPKAIVAKIPLSGVVALVGDAGHAWVVRDNGQPGLPASYQLVGLDLRTNSIMFRAGLGRQQPAIAVGAGRLWLTTGQGQAHGQVVRVDLATGQVLSTIHLRAGPCSALSYSSGHLFAACQAGDPGSTGFWRINPVTQRVFLLARPVTGYVSSVAAAPNALWYTLNDTQIRGLQNTDGNPFPVSVNDRSYVNLVPGTQGLVYSDGSLWALGAGERLARIDAYSGQVTHIYTYRDYDPKRAGGLNYVTAGDGWLWFLDEGYPFAGVLRVNMGTGKPAGGVPIAPNSCGQEVCSQIYFTSGSIWVPTAELLLRIDPYRLPFAS